jgi:hypothetical protein
MTVFPGVERQAIERAITYLAPTIIILYGIILMFVPLNFPTGIDFLFGDTDARSQFTSASYVFVLGLLLFDAVANRRYRVLAGVGIVTLVISIPFLVYRGYGNEGEANLLVSVLLLVSSWIIYNRL